MTRRPVATVPPSGIDVISTSEATIAILYIEIDGQEMEFAGTSKRDPSDKHNPEVGQKLAIGRALSKAGRRLERQANGLVACADHNRQQSIEAAKRPKPAEAEVSRVTARPRRTKQLIAAAE